MCAKVKLLLVLTGWTSIYAASAIFTPTHAATIAAGADFSCEVVDGGVRCWGGNDQGELGNPAFSDVTTATEVAGLRPGTNAGVTAIAAGAQHACAIVNGGLQCWGGNYFGQLGLNDHVDRFTPQIVPNLTGVKGVAAGYTSTCAIAKDTLHNKDAIYCWGNNGAGQLGVGDTQSRTSPSLVFDLQGEGVIAVGDYHACALDLGTSATICWGDNSSGQLGLGSKNYCDPNTPYCLTPTDVSGLSSPVAISAGVRHTCAVTVGGAVYCWGANNHGQLGLGNAVQIEPIKASIQSGAISISARYDGTCAVVNNGVQCWGAGEYGVQGNNSLGDSWVPHPVSSLGGPAADGTVTEVSAGYVHACALYKQSVYCWGAKNHGQLGNGEDERVLTPVTVTGLSAAKQIATGGSHTCALTGDVVNGLGQVKCWGANYFGQLGDGTQVNASLYKVAIGNGATAVAAGESHTCAIVSGAVQCWGANGYYELGIGGNQSSQHKPLPTSPPLVNASAVATGRYHTCAIAGPTSSVYCWGSNDEGQIGQGTTQLNYQSPTPVPGLSNAVAIGAGGGHTCAVLNDGSVWCWGFNSDGQLGVGDQKNRLKPTQVQKLSGVVGIAAGGTHTCALTQSGSIFCCPRALA